MFKRPFWKKNRPVPPDLGEIDAILFDLDGTLVDVDMQRFVPAYLRRLGERMSDLAAPKETARVLREAVISMLHNRDGSITLEKRLYEFIKAELGISAEDYQERLGFFCSEDLPELATLVTGHPLARDLITACLERGWKVVLATNPIFPRAVVDARLSWGGIDDLPFDLITSYETSRYCKPQPEYFREVLGHLGTDAGNSLMVGNDTEHDMAAGQVGVATCLLTPWRIDRFGRNFPADWEGTHEDLLSLFQSSSVRISASPD